MKVWTVSYVNTDTKRSEVSGVFKTRYSAVNQIRFITSLEEDDFAIEPDPVHACEIWTDRTDDENTFTISELEVS